MERVGFVLVATVTAPLWVPGYLLTLGFRWVMGQDQSNDA